MAAHSLAATSHIIEAISPARGMAKIISITGDIIAETSSLLVVRSMTTTMIMATAVVADGFTSGHLTPAAVTGGVATSFVQTTSNRRKCVTYETMF